MNGSEVAYEPTAAQEAAMEEMKEKLGPTPLPVVFQHLLREYPDAFKNDAHDQTVVFVHYGQGMDAPKTSEQQKREMEVLEQEHRGQQESLSKEIERKHKQVDQEKATLEKRQKRQKEELQAQHAEQTKERERVAQQKKEKTQPAQPAQQSPPAQPIKR